MSEPSSRYFGDPWPSGICDTGTQMPTPVGLPCAWCLEVIGDSDQGSFWGAEPVHKECSLRAVIGGIGHLEDHAFWCKGPGDDTDGGRTKRQSALEVWEWVQIHGIPS